MLETFKWNSRYNARGWVTMAGALVVLRALNALRQKGESKRRPPLWKHFDDTHHWDSSAEEWVPNDDRDRATHHASRTPNSETQDPSR
ncbi:hypothetical protein JQ629_36200 [Bradyrhizobium sp. AUGA SZCCT0222]|uniref:hypothetical protein n=1 Tax=Bradyrhizobium sp. AUGA SZCCT0222 TaxID=2807668 RepID=UPI001BA7B835|nr:hypothetical protein [Bradyrhizobium sp. AUGA SZCCT0222]MBR1272925.1 hypothetical protein [Bradyrhizobium sp. AUGA SZCCT0222]